MSIDTNANVNAASAAARAAQTAARDSYGKLVAVLASRSRDVAGAEDALADAFAAALADWPRIGVPRTPDAWLLTVARRRMVDAARRRCREAEASQYLQWLADLEADCNADDGTAGIPDERLQLMFACAHPALERSVRAPLVLQAVLGFDAATIASAFLVAPSTMSQRLVRAKNKIREAGIALGVPERGQLPERLDAVLDAIYAVYSEGWSDPTGSDARRRNLADEGIWLGRLVVSLLPDEPEALGLLALMLHTHARCAARRTTDGVYVPLSEQDVALWDGATIDEAEALLSRASRAGRVGRYQLEAAVQSAHAVRRHGGASDWRAIVQLYDVLCSLSGSPVAALNRAVALAETAGAAAGLAALDALSHDARLAEYQPYWAVRAELSARIGAWQASSDAYRLAIGLEPDPAVRRFLQLRADAVVARDNTVG
ncbi:RNA polymerase sigma factor [Trinickia sp. LjRoot230]|uniref:RNA polymerase sigma factor n=1 Tax=Trinickia sp. LjRoot230 TaxID=3342288 RepID=UPI003F506D70